MDRIILLLRRVLVLIEAYQTCYEHLERDDSGSFLIECAQEAVESAMCILEGEMRRG